MIFASQVDSDGPTELAALVTAEHYQKRDQPSDNLRFKSYFFNDAGVPSLYVVVMMYGKNLIFNYFSILVVVLM